MSWTWRTATSLRTVVKPGLRLMAITVTVSPNQPVRASDAPKPVHHGDGKTFINPWPSWGNHKPITPSNLFYMLYDWKSRPVPPPELLPPITQPNWGITPNMTEDEKSTQSRDIKATWLGHACFLVELPAPEGSKERGVRVLFDPVFSNRCSPSQYVGPARVTKPPCKLEELPDVDAVVLSHNHYDHTDVTTLKHIYGAQKKGTVHFLAPLGNKTWFKSIGFADEHVTELDWWDERDISINLSDNSSSPLSARITCTPCQHMTGRSGLDQCKTLWSSWAVSEIPKEGSTKSPAKVWFGGDTGYKHVPRGAKTEEGLPHCPAFKEIGSKFGSFDLSLVPIGAYDPRFFMSRIHCSPEDAVEVHRDINSKKSIGMHWATWVLTCEEMTEPPKRLKAALKRREIPEEDFIVCGIGETVRVSTGKD